MTDKERLIKSNTKLVDENRYLKIDKEVLEKDIKILMSIIARNKYVLNEDESKVIEKYYYMIQGDKYNDK